MKEMRLNGMKKKMPSLKPVYFLFKSDGIVTLTADGDSHNEYWTYDHNTNTITIKESKNIKRKDDLVIQ